MNQQPNPIALFVDPGTFAAQLAASQSASASAGQKAMSNYGQTGILIPQPPRRRVAVRRINVSFFFTSAWDVTVQAL